MGYCPVMGIRDVAPLLFRDRGDTGQWLAVRAARSGGIADHENVGVSRH
jgi:hypothetical protein